MKRVTPRLAAALIAQIRTQNIVPRGFEVRLARTEDIPALLDIGTACFSYNPPTRRELRYAIATAHAAVIILFDVKTGDIAGFDIYEFNLRHRALYLNLTCLKPEYRGRGLSHTLLRLCHAMAAGAGCRTIRSHVADDNAAMIHLLEKYGHQRGERHKAYYSDKKAAITYRLQLDGA